MPLQISSCFPTDLPLTASEALLHFSTCCHQLCHVLRASKTYLVLSKSWEVTGKTDKGILQKKCSSIELSFTVDSIMVKHCSVPSIIQIQISYCSSSSTFWITPSQQWWTILLLTSCWNYQQRCQLKDAQL